jgi:uncharacterized protein DUF3574
MATPAAGVPALAQLFRLPAVCLFTLILVALEACTSFQEAPCVPEGQSLVETIYFGTNIRNQEGALVGKVKPEAWAVFLDQTVTPLFPKGLTWWTASGQWRSSGGALDRELSYVLRIVHATGEDEDRAVHAIVKKYIKDFEQESVMWVRSKECVSVYGKKSLVGTF